MKRAGTILGYSARSLVENQPVHHQQTLIGIINKVSGVAEAFNAVVAASHEDRTLTREGQAANRANAAIPANASLNTFKVDIDKLMNRAMGIEKASRAKVGPPKDIPPETLREVRDQMRQMSPDERLTIYRTTKDPIVLAAIESAPSSLGSTRQGDGSRRFEPFVPADELVAAQMERATAADPKSATTMNELRQLADAIQRAVNSVRHEIADIAGVTVPEGVQS